MVKERFKGMAGMGGKGKDVAKNRQDKVTAGKKKNVTVSGDKSGANFRRPGPTAAANRKRNQKEWHEQKQAKVRY